MVLSNTKIGQKIDFATTTLKGIGQIMLQENKWTGLIFLLGLFLANWIYGVAVLIATITGTLTAKLFRFPKDEIKSGLYGFSPALVGVGLVVVFKATWFVWLLVLIGGSLAAAIQRFFIANKIPAYTFPFIIVIWCFVFFSNQFFSIPSSNLTNLFNFHDFNQYFFITNGFGEVIFQNFFLSGVLFFLGVLISNPYAAIFGLIASFFGAIIAFLLKQQLEFIQDGLFGFNAVLTAIVFGGKSLKNIFWSFVGVIITIFIHILLVKYNTLEIVGGVFTFPFVAGTWITLFLQNRFSFQQNG